MTTWRTKYRTPAAELRLEDDAMTLATGTEVTTWPLDQVRTPAVRDAVLAAFDIETWVELAAAVSGRGPRTPRPADERRPQVERARSPGRGGGWSMHILGRRVSVRASELKHEGTLEAIRDDGLPPALAAVIPADELASLARAVTALADLPCMCGTGAMTPDQHGTLFVVATGVDPNCPMQQQISCGYCTVCDRWWTFSEEGDSHYSFHYSVRAFDPLA